MIFVKNKWLSAAEASDQLTLSKSSHTLFRVRCDFSISEKCRKEYEIQYRDFIKHTSNNDNRLPCLFCSRTLKFSGRNNPNTRYKNLDDEFFKNIDSEEKAYLLGWIGSDGTIGKRGFTIGIHRDDRDTLIKLRNTICVDIPIKNYVNSTGSPMNDFDVNSISISRDLCEWFQIKPGKKSDIIRLPKLSGEYFWHFIRGYFDGDGTINDPDNTIKNFPVVSIRSSSPKMLSDLKKAVDIRSYLTINHSISWENDYAWPFLDKMYEHATMWLSRKRLRYEKWIDKQ